MKVEHQAVGIGHDRHVTRVASGSANEAYNFVFPCASGELDHVLGLGIDIVIVNRRSNKDTVRVLNSHAQFSRTRHTITFVGIAEWQVHFADVDPIAIDFLFLQMRESNTSHAAAVAVGIAAGANDKMLGHTAMLEVNAQRTTRLRNATVRQALDFEYFREPASNLEFRNLQIRMRSQPASN